MIESTNFATSFQKIKKMKKLFTTLTLIAAISLSAQNLLTNPSFESDLEGWAAGPSSSYTAPEVVSGGSADGDKHVAYNSPSATTGFFQNVAVTAGESYEISFWYKASGDDEDARIWSIFRDAEGAAVYTTEDASTDEFRTLNAYLPTVGEWTMHTAVMPAGTSANSNTGTDAVSLDVAFRAYSGSTVTFDGIKAGIEGSMSVSDVNNFANGVKMNTIVTSKLTLQLPERATVNIYTMEGKLVSSNRVDNGGSIETSSLAKGVYVVKVTNGYATTTQKIVKK